MQQDYRMKDLRGNAFKLKPNWIYYLINLTVLKKILTVLLKSLREEIVIITTNENIRQFLTSGKKSFL